MRHGTLWMRAALAVVLAGLLAGCASLNTVTSEVATYGDWPAGRAAGRYAFERLPSQQAQPQRQAELEAAAARALELAGFSAAGDASQADVIVQLGARITRTDLKRLARLAQEERQDFFDRHPEWAILYGKRMLCAALGGDGALHYLNGITGVSEFQVWTFYAENSEAPFPPYHSSHLDYGASKFGRDSALPESYEGLRVVLHGQASR